jgi:hypothetical protein
LFKDAPKDINAVVMDKEVESAESELSNEYNVSEVSWGKELLKKICI